MSKPPPVYPTPAQQPPTPRKIPKLLAAALTNDLAARPGKLAVQAVDDAESQHVADQFEAIFAAAGWKVDRRGVYAGPPGIDISAPDIPTREWVTGVLRATDFNIREKNAGGDHRVWIQIGAQD